MRDPSRNTRHRLGRRGERVAARFLRRRRHRIVERNYRCPAGEIDLICTHGDTIVFVEVKTRSSDQAQDLQDAVHPAQWRRVEKAGRYFLARRTARDHPSRFDLITVLWPPRGRAHVEHFEDVFQPRRP